MPTKRARNDAKPADSPRPGQSCRTWLMVGPDDFQLDTLARRQIDQLLPPAEQAFGLETIDAAAGTVGEAAAILRRLLETLRTPAMFAKRRLVWARNAAFLDDKIISRGKEILPLAGELATLIAAGLPPEQYLIVTASGVQPNSPLANAFAKHGALLRQEAAKPWRRQEESLAHAARELRQAGLTASPATVAKLVARVGADTRQLHQEIIKLAIYLGARRQVEPDDIGEVVSATRDYFVWDLEDAAAQGNLPQALAILRRLLFQREDPIRLVNTLETRFRYLLILEEAVRNGWITPRPGKVAGGAALPPQLSKVFEGDRRMANPYTRNILAQQAAKFNSAALLRARRDILTARQLLVSSRTPPALIMDLLIIKLCRLAARPKSRGRAGF